MGNELTSFVVCDARSKRVFAPDQPFAMLGVLALDLPQDLWRDFVFFVEETRDAERRGDAESRYRFLRASLLSLFAYVNAFFDMLIESRKPDEEFQNYKRSEVQKRKTSPDWPRCEHGRFVVVYTDFVRSTQDITLPAIDWSIKPLRNILAHANGARDVTVADLYNLDIGHLLTSALSFQSWIVEATKHCLVEYEIDTAKMASEVATAFNKKTIPPPQHF